MLLVLINVFFFNSKIKSRYTRDETDLNDEDPTCDYDILSKVFWEEADDKEEA